MSHRRKSNARSIRHQCIVEYLLELTIWFGGGFIRFISSCCGMVVKILFFLLHARIDWTTATRTVSQIVASGHRDDQRGDNFQ